MYFVEHVWSGLRLALSRPNLLLSGSRLQMDLLTWFDEQDVQAGHCGVLNDVMKTLLTLPVPFRIDVYSQETFRCATMIGN